ncbi:MAG: RNA pyrophosphohydrolase [Alphaproteobacteria bacterium]|nr:RNA pyrophosphohydrolase [Alphaproteobacteria bacterium]
MSLPYRDGVGIMLINQHRQVFVAKRIDTLSEAWQMPQGGIDEGERPDVAARRELEEETGTSKATILRESKDWLTYDLPQELVGKIWRGRFRGQRQKWFAMRFDGTDSDINIDTPHPEFCEWKWIAPSTLPDLIVPFKRVLYRDIIQEFRDLL